MGWQGAKSRLRNHITSPHSRPTVGVWVLLGVRLPTCSPTAERLSLTKMSPVKDDREMNKCTSDWTRAASQDAFSLNKQLPFEFLEHVLYVFNLLGRFEDTCYIRLYGDWIRFTRGTNLVQSPWRWRQYVPTKHLYKLNIAHSAKTPEQQPPWKPENIYQVCSF